jgi:hypothetical protein
VGYMWIQDLPKLQQIRTSAKTPKTFSSTTLSPRHRPRRDFANPLGRGRCTWQRQKSDLRLEQLKQKNPDKSTAEA